MTPKFEQCVLRQSESAAELTAHDRFSSLMDEVIDHPKTPGSVWGEGEVCLYV